ncbi:DUF1269 domain-containing protein [Nocardioides jishulii]|uniref:DUF1269 domain-containing protein n=1 Tax=Nocardioides jishulii TaxID=2575440 RepID=A0A4U2YMX0_9ACTN|nr:DUF1269 domain-containing protein [Nocardioides jishulii]QCX27829.1 DUF1269 domain-containing protein [Nocardioides jishulii]TKI62636.1 DUF1269 domain-containing protein [Nocardioides jishulii]
MATLTVWKFDTPEGAQKAEDALIRLQGQELIQVLDAATVSWPEGKKKPKTRQANDLLGPGLLGGMFWGLLFGIIFFIPIIGLAVGAASGALIGALTDVGINDDFIKDVRAKVTPGTSALFVLSAGAVLDRVHEELRSQGIHGELIQTNLSSEEEAKLRKVVEEGDEA